MPDILKNKNLATRFQILVEIASKGPHIQQRSIARELDLTPQAVSDYITQLIREKMLTNEGRSKYSLSPLGVNWVIGQLKEISDYTGLVQKAVTGISVCAAIAGEPLKAGQRVDLHMENGLLVALADSGGQATGKVVLDAAAGQDVGVADISGIIPLKTGTVTVYTIPCIDKGGSRLVDESRVIDEAVKHFPVISVGLEAYALLARTGIDFYRYAAAESAIEAAKNGQQPLVVCPDNEAAGLMQRFEKARIAYRVISGL